MAYEIRKVVAFILLVVTIFVLLMWPSKIDDSTRSGVLSTKFKSCNEFSYSSSLKSCKVKNCDSYQVECTEDEKKLWGEQKEYLGSLDCSLTDSKCNDFQKKIYDIVKGIRDSDGGVLDLAYSCETLKEGEEIEVDFDWATGVSYRYNSNLKIWEYNGGFGWNDISNMDKFYKLYKDENVKIVTSLLSQGCLDVFVDLIKNPIGLKSVTHKSNKGILVYEFDSDSLSFKKFEFLDGKKLDFKIENGNEVLIGDFSGWEIIEKSCSRIIIEDKQKKVSQKFDNFDLLCSGGVEFDGNSIRLQGDLDEYIKKISNEYGYNVYAIKAILNIESNLNGFYSSGKPKVRFECHVFNRYTNKDISDCKSFGTGLEAFEKALDIDEESAKLGTSFGIAQIMGFNYKSSGYNSVEDFYKAMFNEEEQIKAFFNFISNNKYLNSELRKDLPDWKVVAKYYNGGNYEENNYDNKLASNFNNFKNSMLS